MHVEPKILVKRLSRHATLALEEAVVLAAQGGHSEFTVEHHLAALFRREDGDIALILQQLGLDRRTFLAGFERAVRGFRKGSGGRPAFSTSLIQLFEDAWLLGSLELGESELRSGVLFATLARRPGRYLESEMSVWKDVDATALMAALPSLLAASNESVKAASDRVDTHVDSQTALARFTTNVTADVRAGRIDPVLGRHREIRQLIDILSRRRKNNPVIVGEPGVGKTALVEGLAHAIVNGEVPESLKHVDLLSVDLGALQAGASVKGEFENRLKALIQETKAAIKPVILFIDEAHMLIGAGGAQGGTDAANLLKPALARGELRTIAATTWAEYKRYFEKDAALERRFQPVKVDEPDDATVIAMLRGLRDTFEKAHGVVIRDEAIVDAVKLSSRYISGRQMPDKAIDLLDMTAARVKTSHNARPEPLVAIENELAALGRAESALVRDVGPDATGLVELRATIASSNLAREALLLRWEQERSDSEVTRIDGQARLVHREVDKEAVAQAVSAWTGIPLGNMRTSSLETALTLESTLQARIQGQRDAVSAVSDAMRLAASGIRAPNAPQAVLLFVGPTGVGKTETALALADLLYGGERFMTTINMTEFQEKHSVSRLIGSPPGYVGYGEGGLLTEAVRQRPHSIVLLDECEKADLEVMNLFYQVFDRGMLSDSEGRVVDFRNTVLVLTSNLGSDTLMRLHEPGSHGESAPTADKLIEAIRPELARHFKPALLARMTIVPFRPISDEALRGIASSRLRGIAERVKATHDIDTAFEENVVERLITHANHRHSGARGVDHALRSSLLPSLSRTLLERAAAHAHGGSLRVSVAESGEFAVV